LAVVLLIGCGGGSGSSQTLQVTVRYQRTAIPPPGCVSCEATVEMTEAVYDAIQRCYVSLCHLSAPSTGARVIDCPTSCGIELEGFHNYDATCGYDVPDTNRLSNRCYTP
jgi:hypothetical protein